MPISTKMKIDIKEEIEFPEGYEFSVENSIVRVKYGGNENSRKFNFMKMDVKKEGNKLIIEYKKASKKELKMINTIKAHIANMIAGLKEMYVYKLEIAYVHFPVTLDYDKGNNKITIKNFLGEKKPRVCYLPKGIELEIEKNTITIKSHDKDTAGQAAANLEKATKIKKRDRRKFQDGIFITEKAGRPI